MKPLFIIAGPDGSVKEDWIAHKLNEFHIKTTIDFTFCGGKIYSPKPIHRITRSEYAIIVRGATGIEDVISCMYYFVPNTAVLFILTSNPPRPWDKINNLFPNAILVNLSPPKKMVAVDRTISSARLPIPNQLINEVQGGDFLIWQIYVKVYIDSIEGVFIMDD